MKNSVSAKHHRKVRLGALFVGALLSANAAAELNLTLGQAFTRDDNVFRLSNDAAALAAVGTTNRADTISRTFASLAFDRTVGRQQFLASVGASHNRYQRFSFLNFEGYNLAGAWNWELATRWRGELRLDHTRDLIGYADFRPGGTLPRVLGDTTRAIGSAEYRLDPDWSLIAGLGRIQQDFNSSLLAGSEYRSNYVEAGALNKRPAGNEFGLRYRYTDTEYPTLGSFGARTVDNSFKQSDVLVTTRYQVTGNSLLRGFVGYSWRKFDDVGERDFSSPTARVDYDWTVGATLLLNFTARRELVTVQDVTPSSVVTSAVSVGPRWEITPKTTLEGRAEYGRRDFRGDTSVALGGATRREDTFRGLSITGSYMPTRTILLRLSAIHEKRDSNIDDRSFTANAAVASAQITF